MRHPRLRADYAAVRLPGDGATVMVIGESRRLLIDDPTTVELVELLDGTLEAADLITRLTPRHPPARTGRALRRLLELDLLTDGPATAPRRVAAGWDARGARPDPAEAYLRGGRVLLVDGGSPALAAVAGALTGAGLAVSVVGLDDPVPHTGVDQPVVAVVGSMIDPRLAGLDRACRERRRPYLIVRPHGSVVLFGPHLVPGVTGCWECLRARWQENEQVANYLSERLPDAPRHDAAIAALPADGLIVGGLLVAELPVLVEHGRSARVTGRMLAFDTRDLTASRHVLTRLPQCPACGDPGLLRAGPRIDLEPGEVSEQESRVRPAAQTLARLADQISPYLGMITRLTPLDDGSAGPTFSYSAGHNFAVSRHPGTLRSNLRGNSGGKGRTDVQARVSALAEAVERYCGVWRGDRPVRRAAYAELGPERAVHLRELQHFSADQYAHRDHTNPRTSHFHRVPRPQPDDLVLTWTDGWSLTRQAPRAIPTAYCWYGHPELAEHEVCGADSNGCAAGSTLAEAVLHGFCELVERDSVALWWYHRSRLPGVDLDSFRDPWIDGLREHYDRTLHRGLWAVDITADLGIPAFAAVSPRLDHATEDVLVGFGAHLDPRVALNRALTEVNQFLPAVSTPDGRYGLTEPDTVRWFSTVRVADQPWLRPRDGAPLTTVDTHRRPGIAGTDIAENVERCVRIAAGAGLEVIVVNQSRPDVDLAVVKVIVPGLRHFWRRLGPGRLWDVPVRLGRGDLAAGESAVNPLSVFF